MKKLIAAALCLLCLTGCAVSPYVIRVGEERIDAAEAAFYLYADLALARELGEDTEDPEIRERIYQTALDQIVSASVIRQRCAQLGMTLSEEAEQTIAESKEALKEQLGGPAAYLTWLRDNYMTDRLYDRLQAGNYYYEVLQNYVSAQLEQDPKADELLRQFFAENYTRVRYIRLSRLDEYGVPLSPEEQDARLEQAKSLLLQIWDGADFGALLTQWNDDPQMADGAMAVSRAQAESTDYLGGLFELELHKPAGVYVAEDGYYLLERLPLAANYYDENQETIFHDALDARFEDYLRAGREEYGVSITQDYKKLDLNDLLQYVY